jgi:hypothetical protein
MPPMEDAAVPAVDVTAVAADTPLLVFVGPVMIVLIKDDRPELGTACW